MLDEGIALLGGLDASTLGVRSVCRSTGITERYFYEAFGTRDGFAHAVYDDIAERAQQALTTTFRHVRDAAYEHGEPVTATTMGLEGVTSYVRFVADQPEVGRALLLGPYREPALADRGLLHRPGFISVVGSTLPRDLDPTSRRLVATGLVGALITLSTEYVTGRLDVTRDELVTYCVRLIESAVRDPVTV
ncbi:Uncharacterised protein [Tsukamurella paurometabola]|uniref:HTH tetR-type domain-containing protein n=2 Tax=Tsukamurella paurometabola TaxID=2061 RepID=A0A3P8MA71_TSUPA|nr:Uncharacterised protein [Tsukamurella paurometabola]